MVFGLLCLASQICLNKSSRSGNLWRTFKNGGPIFARVTASSSVGAA